MVEISLVPKITSYLNIIQLKIEYNVE